MIYHLAYHSRAPSSLDTSALLALERSSEQQHQAMDVTGVLVFDGLQFLQVLEGRLADVEALYRSAQVDARFTDIGLLLLEPVEQRMFHRWSLRHLERPALSTPHIDWSEAVSSTGPNKVRRLIEAFTLHGQSVSSPNLLTENPYMVREPTSVGLGMGSQAIAAQSHLFAFQPIVDPMQKRIAAVEAVMRGPGGEAPCDLLDRLQGYDKYVFDVRSKASAFALAQQLHIECPLSINILPMALVTVPDAIPTLLRDAQRHGFAPDQIVVELTEQEAITHQTLFLEATDALRRAGIGVALDDFGAGYAGLSLLANFQPDRLKIDKAIICGVDHDQPRQAIVRAILDCCYCLSISVVVEGVETPQEMHWLLDHGVRQFQGYLFAEPKLAGVPDIHWPPLLTGA